ncbi:hypothetical protein ACI2LF_30355 [Kribbella sp. NPDC020789]
MRTRIVAALVIAPLVALTLTAPAAQAAPNPKLTITKVELNKLSVAVSSLNTVPVRLTVTGGYASTDPRDADLTMHAYLKRKTGTGLATYLVSLQLTRTSGTTPQGTWAGNVNVPSTANGTFEVIGVMTGTFSPGSGDMTDPTPVPNAPVLTVTGTNTPKITARVIPEGVPIGSGYTIRWSVINSQTAKPYGTRLKVWLPNDNGCVEQFGGPQAITDTNGYVSKAYPASLSNYVNCLQLPGYPAPIGALGLFVKRPITISASPSKTSAPVGTIVPVNGTVRAPTCSVILQRLYGATAWRNVGTAKVRQSGRFTVNAQPAYKGYIPYRVFFPTCLTYASAKTKVFTIRGL